MLQFNCVYTEKLLMIKLIEQLKSLQKKKSIFEF